MNQEEIVDQLYIPTKRRFLRPGERASPGFRQMPTEIQRTSIAPELELAGDIMERRRREAQKQLAQFQPPPARRLPPQPQYIASSSSSSDEEEEEEEEASGTDRDTEIEQEEEEEVIRGEPEKQIPPRPFYEEEDEIRFFVDLNFYDEEERRLLPPAYLISEKDQWTIILNAVKSNFYQVGNMERVSNKLIRLVADAASLSPTEPRNAVQMLAYARQRQV